MWDLVAGAQGNTTLPGFNWEPQPTRRGSFSILATCFVTLALCTWKIVHLNLPGVCPQADLPWSAWWRPGTTRSARHRLIHIFGGHQVARQIGWLLIGLFTPELVAFAAFEQYWDARSLQQYMEQVYLEQEPEATSRSWFGLSRRNRAAQVQVDAERDASSHAEKRVWTMTHSWYAVMGGYCYHLRDPPSSTGGEGRGVHLPDDSGRRELALRDEGVRLVARHEPEMLPRLTAGAILDKSSASALVKAITLAQALWFGLGCVARMGQGLAVSLLELTTFAHCVVGLVIGWLWLRKPLDIAQADALEVPAGRREPHWLMAMLYTLSSFDGDETDEEKFGKLAPRTRTGGRQQQQGEGGEGASDVDPAKETQDGAARQVYLDPPGGHAPMSFTELDLDLAAATSTRPPSSRPATGATSHLRPQTAQRSPAAAAAAAAADAATSPAQSLSELIQAAADAERNLRIRMHMADKGWEHYVFGPAPQPQPPTSSSNGSPSAPAPPPTHLTTGPGDGDGGGATTTTTTSIDLSHELAQSRHIVQRRMKQALQNTLVDRVTNLPRYQPHHHASSSSSAALLGEGVSPPLQQTQTHRSHTIRTHLGITLTGFLYGGLHLLAWDATFGTRGEAALWRVGALSLAASGLLVPVSRAEALVEAAVRPWLAMDEEDRDAEEAAHLAEKAAALGLWGRKGGGSGWRWRRRWWRVYKWGFLWMVEVLRVLKVLVVVGVATVYFGLRIFIFLECLVNVAHLPPSAYEVVQWSQYVPHIS